MLRGVADANVLISALVAPRGVCGQLWVAVSEGRWQPVISDQLMHEVEGVLGREKFRRWVTIDQVARFIASIWETAEVVPDAPQPWPVVTRDPKDDYIVALARAAGVEVIVSGDIHLTELFDLAPPVTTPVALLGRLADEQ